MEKINWLNEKRRIQDLNPAPYNPRQMTEKQAADLGESLDRFDLADPIIINRDNTIIGGHQRINMLRMKGVDEVDVRVPARQLTNEEEVELNLRLNKNLGEWDWDALANIDLDFLKGVGFEEKDFGIGDDSKGTGAKGAGMFVEQMELKAFEHWDYIVFVFDNQFDFMKAMQEFDLKAVDAGYDGVKKIGIGRVVKGAKLIEKIGHKNPDTEPGQKPDDHQSQDIS